MTIISASYRTDIPAFHGDWFAARLAAGFCDVKNPYGGKPSRLSLTPADVSAFVFWTRNIRPFEDLLHRRIGERYPFMVQFTLTGYPKWLEKSVPARADAVRQIQELARAFGKDVCVWRYDPILISDLTPVEFHLSQFADLAAKLSGHVNEVVVSFAQFYAKTKRNLDKLAARTDFEYRDPGNAQKQEILSRFSEVALKNGMTLSLCTQPQFLADGVKPARCIDATRLAHLGMTATGIAQKGKRDGCACSHARDIGAYDSCPHGCLYCYAVSSPERAKRVYKNRDVTHTALGG